MNYKRTRFACFYSYLSTASVFSLPPLLFLTFREMYGVSYTLLGTLVLINFCTQLLIDLIFTFFARFFNVKATVRMMPLLTSLGLFIYALIPSLFPQFAYVGLVVGTLMFSTGAGLSEVLVSPTVAALPSDHPERDMSALHSLYAYGVLFVIIVSTIFLRIFGTHMWMYLTGFFAVLPIITSILFCASPIPDICVTPTASGKTDGQRNLWLLLFTLCIFFGSATENSMTNWISGFVESALGISKTWGDLFGMAMFAVLLGLGRTLYSRFGKNISNVILFGMIGGAVCYIVSGLASNAVISLIACVLTGFFSSMLWPGTLIMMEEQLPGVGVVAYALMAAGGDFGGSVAPQLLGAVVDRVCASEWAAELGVRLSLTAEQIGMKVGFLTAAIFPIIGIAVVLIIRRVVIRPGCRNKKSGEGSL